MCIDIHVPIAGEAEPFTCRCVLVYFLEMQAKAEREPLWTGPCSKLRLAALPPNDMLVLNRKSVAFLRNESKEP